MLTGHATAKVSPIVKSPGPTVPPSTQSSLPKGVVRDLRPVRPIAQTALTGRRARTATAAIALSAKTEALAPDAHRPTTLIGGLLAPFARCLVMLADSWRFARTCSRLTGCWDDASLAIRAADFTVEQAMQEASARPASIPRERRGTDARRPFVDRMWAFLEAVVEAEKYRARRQVSANLRTLSDKSLKEIGFSRTDIALLRAGNEVDFPS